MDRLDAMRCFIQIVESGSLSAASRKHGRSLAGTVRTLAALEARLGIRLLERTTRTLRLTEEGADYLERARAVCEMADEADALVMSRRGRLAGRLVVTAPVVFGRLYVAPQLLALLKAEPELTTSLVLTDRVMDFIDDGVDVAVRIGHLPDSSLRATTIGATRWIYCASPSYIDSNRVPSATADPGTLGSLELTATGVQANKVSFSCNNADVLVQTAIAGHGVVRVLSYQVADAIREGRLVEVFPERASPPLPISVVHPQARIQSPRVTAFREAMISLRGSLAFDAPASP